MSANSVIIWFFFILWLGINLPVGAQSTPTISPSTGSYTTPQAVTLSASSGSIFFTTNGSTPTNLSTPYTSAIPINGPCQINAVSFLSGVYSPVSSAFLDVDPSLGPILQPGLLLRMRADFGVTTTSGNLVSSWIDLSGNNNTASGTSGSQPTLQAAATNGNSALVFSGSQNLTLPSGFADFTRTFITVSGGPPVTNSGVQTITINSTNNASSTFYAGTSNASIASGMAYEINNLALPGISATSNNTAIVITSPLGTTFSVHPSDNVLMAIQNCGATLFVLTVPSSLNANSRIFDLGQAASGNNILFQVAPTGSFGQFSSYAGTSGTSAQSGSALIQGQSQLLEAVETMGASNSTATFYVNGQAGSPNSTMANITNTTRTSNFIGQASNGGNFYSGAISEFALYTSALTSSQREAIEAFYLQKYQTLTQAPLTPIISVPSGTLSQPIQVVISSPPNTQTHFTLDGSLPTSSSPTFTGSPILVSYSQTLKTIAIRNGISSSVASATYLLAPSQFPAPNPSDVTPPTINLQLPVPSI